MPHYSINIRLPKNEGDCDLDANRSRDGIDLRLCTEVGSVVTLHLSHLEALQLIQQLSIPLEQIVSETRHAIEALYTLKITFA